MSEGGEVITASQLLETDEKRSLSGKEADQVPSLRAVFNLVPWNVGVRLSGVAVEKPVTVERGQADRASLTLCHYRGQKPAKQERGTQECHRCDCVYGLAFVNPRVGQRRDHW